MRRSGHGNSSNVPPAFIWRADFRVVQYVSKIVLDGGCVSTLPRVLIFLRVNVAVSGGVSWLLQ